MTSKLLTPGQIADLLHKNEQAETARTGPKTVKMWFHEPKRKRLIVEALNAGEDHIMIGRRRFGLKLRKRTLVTGVEETVFVFPLTTHSGESSFVPRGELLIRRLTEEEGDNTDGS